jgi:hypothetical protein
MDQTSTSRKCNAAALRRRRVGPLILPKARLVFRGVADVEYHETDSVQGGLWEITRDCECPLHRYDGVNGHSVASSQKARKT